jgi:16S rRNA (cytosine1402-N4)-methyltransferase
MLPRGARVARASARAARRDDFARRRVGAAKPTARRRATTTRDEGAPHASVMMDEVLEAFRDVRARTHVDGTLGAGGHARAMIEAHEEMEHFVGFDVDASAHALARPRLERARAATRGDEATTTLRLSLVEANFRRMREALRALDVDGVDSVVLDLGVSSMHLDRAERGFSFMNDGPLDMRMGESATTTAEEIVNAWPEEEIGRILREYGEEKHWRLLARRICERRAEKEIRTTRELVDAIGNVPGKWGSIHPATRTFQGIRIAVNDELGAVEDVIPAAIEALRPGGRLAIISFHSLEDSIVKRRFRHFAGRAEPPSEEVNRYMPQPEAPPKIVKLITRKPKVPTSAEIDVNVRSRSAKLRVCEKL